MIFQDFGRTEKKLLLLVLSLLFCFWLFAGSATASASGTPDPQTVTLEVAELNRLDSIFSQLSQVNGKLQNELTDSKTALIKSQAELKRAQQELKQLQLQIATLKALSVNQENSLQKVNESFKQYAEEQKRTRLRIKAQRNTWEAVATCLVIALAVK